MTLRRRSEDEILSIVRGAFKPYECGAEFWDYGRHFRFRVFAEDGEVLLSNPKVPRAVVEDDADLKDLLDFCRRRLTDRGYELDSRDSRR